MENIKVSGIKQFALEISNFLINLILMVVILIACNLYCFDIIEYNIALAVFFLLCLLLQNVFFKSLFYAIFGYKIECENKRKLRVFGHNFMFNAIIIGSIVVSVCGLAYGIKLISNVLLIPEVIPCFMKKYHKSLSCCIFKIETMKIQMKKKIILHVVVPVFAIALVILLSIWVGKAVGPDDALRDRLHALKEAGLIADFDNFRWEYDFRSIARFDVRFLNGKIGEFTYAELKDGKIEFKRLYDYDNHIIYGYEILKENGGINLRLGIEKLFDMHTVEDVIENLESIDAVINEMPVMGDEYPHIYEEDFLSKLPEKVLYEDDEVKIIFFRIIRF